MAEFKIDRFVELSKKVDLSDIDWDAAARIGITDEEHRILRFMSDTESHTIIYLRDLLAGHTAADPEVMAFLSCWVYEETHHGRALDRFMAAAGRTPANDRFTTVTKKYTFREELTGSLSRLGARLSPHFAAAHMCWGAINELTAAASYMALARRTQNTELVKLITKLAKDERKHYAFYYSQCEKRIAAGGWKARWLCTTTIRRFWEPVGIGVGEPNTLEFIASYLFGDERGKAELKNIDETVAKLPGMAWFRMTGDWQAKGQARYRTLDPKAYAQHREWERTIWSGNGEAEAA